jgi:hypothetical protein
VVHDFRDVNRAAIWLVHQDPMPLLDHIGQAIYVDHH